MSKKQSIYHKVIDQIKTGTHSPIGGRWSNIGSFIIILSGLALYADKAMTGLDITPFMPDKFAENGVDPGTFIWFLGVTISPLLIILGSILKPYFFSYAVPIYCYILQLYFILIDYSMVDNGYSYTYSTGISIILLIIMYFARTASQKSAELMIKKAREQILNSRRHDETN